MKRFPGRYPHQALVLDDMGNVGLIEGSPQIPFRPLAENTERTFKGDDYRC
jgi:hypothetical protein